MREVAGAEHRVDKGDGIGELARFGGGDGKQAEGVGVEAVELALMAEAR